MSMLPSMTDGRPMMGSGMFESEEHKALVQQVSGAQAIYGMNPENWPPEVRKAWQRLMQPDMKSW